MKPRRSITRHLGLGDVSFDIDPIERMNLSNLIGRELHFQITIPPEEVMEGIDVNEINFSIFPSEDVDPTQTTSPDITSKDVNIEVIEIVSEEEKTDGSTIITFKGKVI